jgi:hypothetical protein
VVVASAAAERREVGRWDWRLQMSNYITPTLHYSNPPSRQIRIVDC